MTETKPTATQPAPGPQSTKPVVANATPIKDPDGGEAPKNPVPDNQAADKAKAEAEAEAKAKADEEFEKARLENDGKITPEAQKALDALNGDDPDDVFADEDTEYKKAVGAPDDLKAVFEKFHKLHRALPETTPDSHTIWGAGGVVLTLGDIRTLIRYMR